MILSSTVSISVFTLFLLPSVHITVSTDVVVAIFGKIIVLGNDSSSSLYVIPDDLFRFNLMKTLLQDSVTTENESENMS